MVSRKVFVLFLLTGLFISPISGQSVDTEAVPDETVPVDTKKIDPVLPGIESSIIFIEGEDAVSTNFNREPLLNYSCSGYRTLQLNQTTQLHEGSSYNSDYVFYVEEDGIYEFWYGGTPPGNRDELLPSYASPFRYVLDGIYIEDIYRENINVVEEYAPAYYWNYVKTVSLSAGEHRIKIEIPEKRNHDGRFFFYLDNFFFIKQENGTRVISGAVPEVFPEDLDNREIDSAFLSLVEYEALIKDNPENHFNYIYLSKIYSLIGDYLNSLKYLNKAAFLEPDNPDIMLLTAKNMIWRGATQNGLELYKDLLKIVPERIDIWTEAGKVAGWIGQYYDSIDFFEGGLENSPDDLSLMANLGITYLWLGNLAKAEKQFEKIKELTGEDYDLNMNLAEVFRTNGYPDKAIPIYKGIQKLYPEILATYFELEDSYIENGQREKIDDLRKLTENTFTPGSEYNKVVSTFYNTQSMKEKVITDYEEQLLNDPNNLTLRKILAEIYFWNGYKKKAISEYRNILTNHTYLNLQKTEKDLTGFLELMDRNYGLLHFMKGIPQYISQNQKELSSQLKNYLKIQKDLETLKKKNEAAATKGKAVDTGSESLKETELLEKEEQLASLIYKLESFIEMFNTLSTQLEDETGSLNRLLEDEKNSMEVFEKLTTGVNWEWDRTEMVAELNKVKKEGVVLANYSLGRIYQYEGNLNDAKSNFLPIFDSATMLKGAPFALFETEIWLGEIREREDLYKKYQKEIDESCNYIFFINDYLEYLNVDEDEEVFGYLTEDATQSVKSLLDQFDALKKESPQIYKSVELNISKIQEVLVTNMRQGFFNLSSNTYLLRNELGDFYYNEKMYSEAISQYKQVLAIDPWNLSAKFNLARVYHLNDDWSKALDIYRDIYEEDPQYNNVASLYNELTRKNSDSFDFIAKSFSDTSRLTFNAQAEYKVNFGKYLGLIFNYTVEHDRVYRDFTPNYASSYLYHNPNIGFPLSLSKFSIIPEAGLYFKTNLVNDLNNPDFTENPSLPDLLGTYSVYFRGGVTLLLSTDPAIIQGTYNFDWQKDSFQPYTNLYTDTIDDPVSYHQAMLDLNFNFIKTKIPFIENTTIYLGGNGKFMNDSNITWSASTIVTNSIKMVREPVMNLDISLSFSYEDSTFELSTSPATKYWYPEGSLITGITLGYFVGIDLSRDITLTENVWFNTDFVSNGADNSKGLNFEIGNRLEFTKKDFTVYLNILGTFDKQLDPLVSGFKYWSVTIELGVNTLLPDLLTP